MKFKTHFERIKDKLSGKKKLENAQALVKEEDTGTETIKKQDLPLVGDLNNDGVVDEKDLSIVHKAYAKSKKVKTKKKSSKKKPTKPKKETK